MKRAIKVVLWTFGVLFALFVLMLIVGVVPWVFDVAGRLALGWLNHAVTVLPKVAVNGSGVGMLAVCLALTAGLGQWFCAWLWRSSGHADPWRSRWTAAGLAAIVVMFAAGMAFTAVAHQTGWLLRTDERLLKSDWSNDRNASTSLKTLTSAQAEFRSFDRDDNKILDFWRGDIAGLYTLKGADGVSLKLIELSIAAADYESKSDLTKFAERQTKAGYWYKTLKFRDEQTPDPNRWAACAFPSTLSAGKYMFIVSDENTIYRKLAETPIPDVYPDDPLKEGWAKLD